MGSSNKRSTLPWLIVGLVISVTVMLVTLKTAFVNILVSMKSPWMGDLKEGKEYEKTQITSDEGVSKAVHEDSEENQ